MTTTLGLDANAIGALLQRDVKPVLFLGAGASVKSGIPLSSTLVDLIARFAYCNAYNRNPDDPTLMRSDWIRWLEQQPWYNLNEPQASLYPIAVERLLQPQSNRKAFFRRVLRSDLPPSDGYRRLANLLGRRMVTTILTSNFDDLVKKAAAQNPTVRHVEQIVTESDRKLFRTNPQYPQVVYLHGSVDHYTDRNLINETQELDKGLASLLHPLLRDHPLVVIGYRGFEPSIMKHLLINQAERCNRFTEGIYWCHLRGHMPISESPLIAELNAAIGSNLQFVEIDGFDELMAVVEESALASRSEAWLYHDFQTNSLSVDEVNDLQPSDIGVSGLNESLLRTKLHEYAAAMRLPLPAFQSSQDLNEALFSQNLALPFGKEIRATKGGQLLFANGVSNQIENARVQVEVSGPPRWVSEILDIDFVNKGQPETLTESTAFVGDLWSQLEQASNILSRVNRPFRMKGPVSQTVFPYPPLALKELLTNVLAHRDYSVGVPSTIVVKRDQITFKNPGGLVDSVRVQLDEDSIQQAIGNATRRLKGYRNPVIADFFFSAGAMDKEGSGLPDVIQEAANNLNDVQFGPAQDNSAFVAVIRCRPEALQLDEETRTARPQQGELRYSPNLLSITEWPERIQKLGTIATPKEIAQAERGECPPFGVYKNWIWTFGNLTRSDAAALIDLCVLEERAEVPTQELLNDDRTAVAVIPRLLNSALASHLKHLGMMVRYETGKLRAYFPTLDGQPVEISYRSSFRQSRRTVTKPIISKSSGKVVFWEHKAVSLRFEKFGVAWALALLPSYIFTIDGHSRPINSDRIGPLTTRRAARDYNPTVFHDLVFWARMISAGSESNFSMPLSFEENGLALRITSMIPTFVFQESIDTGIASPDEPLDIDDEAFDALQIEIEQEIVNVTENVEDQDEATDC